MKRPLIATLIIGFVVAAIIGVFHATGLLVRLERPIADFIAHHGRANRAFVDGHLESEDLRPNFRATDSQLCRWNIDNLLHRNLLRD